MVVYNRRKNYVLCVLIISCFVLSFLQCRCQQNVPITTITFTKILSKKMAILMFCINLNWN